MDPADADALDDDLSRLLDLSFAESSKEDTARGAEARGRHFRDGDDVPAADHADDLIADADELPVVPLLPAMADSIESVRGAVAALAARLDGLVASTNSLRAASAEQLADHAAAMTTLVRAQAGEVEEHRRANERVVADLRRTGVHVDEATRRLAARFDEVIDRIDELERSVALMGTLGGGDGAAGADPASLGAAIRDIVGSDFVTPVQQELAQLKRRLAVRARAPLSLGDDEIDQLADAVASRLGDRAIVNVTQGQLSVLADAVADRLMEIFEVMPDDQRESGRRRGRR